MGGVIEVQHPLVKHHLTILRDVQTAPALFRLQMQRLTTLLAYAATADLPSAPKPCHTPLATIMGHQVAETIGLVPILRAGLGMVDVLQELMPEAAVWHLGLYRDEETATPVQYYAKLPVGGASDVCFVLDPMLATGGSAVAALELLSKWGCADLRVLSLIASQNGIDRVVRDFPEASIYVAAIDAELNASNYIVPGLGDAGDRLFNT